MGRVLTAAWPGTTLVLLKDRMIVRGLKVLNQSFDYLDFYLKAAFVSVAGWGKFGKALNDEIR